MSVIREHDGNKIPLNTADKVIEHSIENGVWRLYACLIMESRVVFFGDYDSLSEAKEHYETIRETIEQEREFYIVSPIGETTFI
tara:strand:+ start:8485 stop:8736 length:252 start_codon:yes stop_codon:yes gene_type:complete